MTEEKKAWLAGEIHHPQALTDEHIAALEKDIRAEGYPTFEVGYALEPVVNFYTKETANDQAQLKSAESAIPSALDPDQLA